MEKMRKEMVLNDQKVKLFNDLKVMFQQVNECHGIINDPEDDKEMMDIAKEELEVVEE